MENDKAFEEDTVLMCGKPQKLAVRINSMKLCVHGPMSASEKITDPHGALGNEKTSDH